MQTVLQFFSPDSPVDRIMRACSAYSDYQMVLAHWYGQKWKGTENLSDVMYYGAIQNFSAS